LHVGATLLLVYPCCSIRKLQGIMPLRYLNAHLRRCS
jgi:hypothetical protein